MATVSELMDTLETHLDYPITGSVASARQVLVASERLLVRRGQSASHDGSSITYDLNQLRQIAERARAFLQANAAGSRVRFLGTQTDFRR